MNVEIAPERAESRSWNSADVSRLSASEVADFVRSSAEDGEVHLERKGGRTFVVAGD
ncbi:hypothetical protein [Haladaptatus salinisoli]|uniref:hypothetical protein n=1 Tax=Haladaptatus salinisoli TaxID=2884876 RepID=UPI001D0A20CE|nr:hypothetical protein [Haladaptatus salinisoli]